MKGWLTSGSVPICVFGLVGFGGVAEANTLEVNAPEIPLRIEIDGTKDCPIADTFYDEVEERTEHARRAKEGELGWSASISVKAVGDRRLARIKLMATEGEWLERELVAPNCGDALEALAVVLAVLVDTAVGQSQSSGASPAETDGISPPPLIPLPRVATGVYIPWIDDPDFFEKRGIAISPSRFVGSFSASVELDTQLARHAALGMGVGFEIERWSPNRLRPSFGLSLGWSTAEVGGDGPRANLQRWSLRAHICPFDLLQGRHVSLRPCSRIDGGYVYAYLETAGSPNPQDESRRFGMVRLSPFLRLNVAIASGCHLRFDAGLDLLVRRPEIVFERSGRSVLIHSPAPFGAYLAMLAAVEF